MKPKSTRWYQWFIQERWSPYASGLLLGLLVWFSAASAHKMLGVSTTFVRAVGMLERTVVPTHVENNAYFAKTHVKLDWQFMLVIGIFFGAAVSAWLSRDMRWRIVPELWKARFGPHRWKRFLGAFVGGFLVLFGARLAGGCTSGHGISGSLQLAVSGWAFFAATFLAGVAVALSLYGKYRSQL